MLRFFAFFFGVALDVGDGTMNIGGVVEEDVPAFAGPGRGRFAVASAVTGERVEAVLDEFFGGGLFEGADDLLDIVMVAGDDHVDVFGEDGAGINEVGVVVDDALEGAGDGEGLKAGELDGGVGEGFFGGESCGAVVRAGGDRTAGGDFGGGTEAEEFPGVNEIGPGSAGVVGEPEAVGGEDDVGGEDHERLRAKGGSANRR